MPTVKTQPTKVRLSFQIHHRRLASPCRLAGYASKASGSALRRRGEGPGQHPRSSTMTPKHWRGDGGPGDRALLHITADDLVREELASTGPRSLQTSLGPVDARASFQSGISMAPALPKPWVTTAQSSSVIPSSRSTPFFRNKEATKGHQELC